MTTFAAAAASLFMHLGNRPFAGKSDRFGPVGRTCAPLSWGTTFEGFDLESDLDLFSTDGRALSPDQPAVRARKCGAPRRQPLARARPGRGRVQPGRRGRRLGRRRGRGSVLCQRGCSAHAPARRRCAPGELAARRCAGSPTSHARIRRQTPRPGSGARRIVRVGQRREDSFRAGESARSRRLVRRGRIRTRRRQASFTSGSRSRVLTLPASDSISPATSLCLALAPSNRDVNVERSSMADSLRPPA